MSQDENAPQAMTSADRFLSRHDLAKLDVRPIPDRIELVFDTFYASCWMFDLPEGTSKYAGLGPARWSATPEDARALADRIAGQMQRSGEAS